MKKDEVCTHENVLADPAKPWWQDAAGAAVLFLIVGYIVLLCMDRGWRERFEAASQTFGILATVGTVAALVLLVRQVEMQRLALDDQRRALDEQRRTSRLAMFDSLQDAYADYLGAATELFAFFGYFGGLFPSKKNWDARVDEYREQFDRHRVEVTKHTVRLALFDRSEERNRIRSLLSSALGHARRLDQLFMDARAAALELRKIAVTRDPATGREGKLDDFTEAWLGYVTNDMFERIDADAVKRMQTASLRLAQLALRSSLAAEEAGVLKVSPQRTEI